MTSDYTRLNNGKYSVYKIAEITAVPYFELLHQDLDRANYYNQVFSTQLVSSLHKRAELNNTAFELLWCSMGVTNQTYKAQVKFYLIARQIDDDLTRLLECLDNTMISIINDFEDKNFSIRLLDNPNEINDFMSFLARVNTTKVLAVAKKERAVMSQFGPAGGLLYYTDVVEPSEDINMTAITNVMTQYPDSAISMQIIPTSYNQNELLAIEQINNYLNMYAGNIRFRQGLQIDSNAQALIKAYEYYIEAAREEIFYFNFIIYSRENSAFDLAHKLINLIELEGKATGSCLEFVDISQKGFSPAANFALSPWVISDALIFKLREMAFWGTQNAPNHLIRLKYLMTLKEVRTVFKLPIDDGKAIGLTSNKVLSNRERLDHTVISEDNFKIGIILNASGSVGGTEAHAGIALNDFTKHGLIVGMPGSGKTNFSLGLLLQFWNRFNIPFLAIEPTKNEYRSLIDSIPDLQIFTPGKNDVSPYIINPFIPPRGVTVESFVPSLMTAFKAAFSMPNPLPDIFLGAVNDCYNLYGWRSNSTIEDSGIELFGLYEFIKVFKRKIKNLDYKGEVKANMESAGVVRLISLIEQNSNIYDTINTIPIEDLLKKPTVIELNAINNKEQKSLIMALLLILICVYTKNNVAGDGKLKNLMLIDEAHVLLGGSSMKSEDSADAQGSTIEALEDLIAEIRSYGTGIFIADQSPTKVGRNIIANTNVKIIFKLVEKENKDAISTATNMTDADYDLLGRLGVGQAMLHYGRVYNPLHIQTYNVQEYAKLRPVISDSDIAAASTYWQTRKELLIPHRECPYNCECQNYCNLEVRANGDFLAIRLINDHLYSLHDRETFVRFLVANLDKHIQNLLLDYDYISGGVKLINCTKIKFLRKAVLIKSYDISKTDYHKILSHRNFLKREVTNE